MSASADEARGWPALLAPRPSWGRRTSAAVAVACTAAVAAVFLGDHATGGSSTVGALGALPVLVGAWFLPRRWTLAVTVLALLFRLLALVLGDITTVTFGSQSLVLVMVALAGSVASTSVTRAAIAQAALP